jgi:cAMP phosphodiesterase
MGAYAGMNELTVEQRLSEIAACLAQGIVDLHKQGRLGTSSEEFATDSQESLDFGLDSGLSVNSGSISGLSNNYQGGTNVVECD